GGAPEHDRAFQGEVGGGEPVACVCREGPGLYQPGGRIPFHDPPVALRIVEVPAVDDQAHVEAANEEGVSGVPELDQRGLDVLVPVAGFNGEVVPESTGGQDPGKREAPAAV